VVRSRQEEVSADIFDMLLSMSDFQLFKEQMVDYREQCVEKTSDNFLCISGRPTCLHTDMDQDMEDGEERADLMDALVVKPLSPQGGLDSRDGPPAFGIVPMRNA